MTGELAAEYTCVQRGMKATLAKPTSVDTGGYNNTRQNSYSSSSSSSGSGAAGNVLLSLVDQVRAVEVNRIMLLWCIFSFRNIAAAFLSVYLFIFHSFLLLCILSSLLSLCIAVFLFVSLSLLLSVFKLLLLLLLLLLDSSPCLRPHIRSDKPIRQQCDTCCDTMRCSPPSNATQACSSGSSMA